MAIKKAQTGTAVKKTVAPKPIAPKAKGMQRAFKYNAPLKTETASAQTGKSVKKTAPSKPVAKPAAKKLGNNALIPGMGLSPAFPKETESISAKVGKSVKKYQMGGYVSNEFAAKSVAKSKPKSKIVDSEIKTKKGKDIYAFEGKKGMLAKSGTKLKNKK